MGLDGVEFILATEEAFQIAIPDEDAERMFTPRAVVDYVIRRLGEVDESAATAALTGGGGWSRGQVEEVVARLMREQLGIKAFGWDQEFVKDLGVD